MGETFNPWKYCLATYEENNDNPVKPLKKVTKKNKEKDKTFECSLCSKKFGWTTDLKRHLLIHTGIHFLLLRYSYLQGLDFIALKITKIYTII